MSVAPARPALAPAFMRVLAGVATMAALGGCATAPPTRADLDGRVVCDVDRMASVESRAQRDGIGLHWVNCPRATLRVVDVK